MHLNNLPKFKTFRRKLRSKLTPAEARLWSLIQNSQIEGRKFRRQHSFDGYILDFYCPKEKLGIELDGEVHLNEKAAQYDYERKLFMEYFGIKILRFENKYVFDATEWVLDTIRSSFGWRKDGFVGEWIDE